MMFYFVFFVSLRGAKQARAEPVEVKQSDYYK